MIIIVDRWLIEWHEAWRPYSPNSIWLVTSLLATTRYLAHAFLHKKKSWRNVTRRDRTCRDVSRLSDSTARHARHDECDTCFTAWAGVNMSILLFPEVNVPEIDANSEHKRLNLFTWALLRLRCPSCRNKHVSTRSSRRTCRVETWRAEWNLCCRQAVDSIKVQPKQRHCSRQQSDTGVVSGGQHAALPWPDRRAEVDGGARRVGTEAAASVSAAGVYRQHPTQRQGEARTHILRRHQRSALRRARFRVVIAYRICCQLYRPTVEDTIKLKYRHRCRKWSMGVILRLQSEKYITAKIAAQWRHIQGSPHVSIIIIKACWNPPLWLDFHRFWLQNEHKNIISLY